MSTLFHTDSAEETQRIGVRLARHLRGGEIILLQGDLGVGKTQLTKGIARGLDVVAEVVSPTFTLVVHYEGRLPLAHYDLYRIEQALDLQEIGYLEEDDPQTVRAVELGERAPVPPGAIRIAICMTESGLREIELHGLVLDPKTDEGDARVH
jgi:tRNA threonylcarbamoyladenosine biosynthesis protein TsaE